MRPGDRNLHLRCNRMCLLDKVKSICCFCTNRTDRICCPKGDSLTHFYFGPSVFSIHPSVCRRGSEMSHLCASQLVMWQLHAICRSTILSIASLAFKPLCFHSVNPPHPQHCFPLTIMTAIILTTNKCEESSRTGKQSRAVQEIRLL